ncbi:MAG: gliding motility-associated C-terminal domain-containing protein [Bacteroidetes bacterium]|nr:gliding motility-associated C-terminal domain-containing protein [Bacteroidota bacterium]
MANGVSATHIVGGDIAVKWMTGNDFEVTLTFFRDCSPTSADFDAMVEVGIYDKVSNVMALSFTMPLISRDTLQLGDSCFTPQNLCVEKGIFQTVLTIPPNPDGYYIAWQRCCRNFIILNIQNPGAAGMVFYAEVPDPALHDNSPVFGSYPNAYMCAGEVNLKSFACYDPDGDSLAYSLVTPMNGFTDQTNVGQYPGAVVLTPGPYPGIAWQSPYDAFDMMGGSPPMNINTNTGMITAQPVNLGVYVFAVKVEEFRNGMKIGEVRRDIQYQVLNCLLISPPVFSSPAVTTVSSSTSSLVYNLVAGDSLSFDVTVTNNNSGDTLFLNGSSEIFSSQIPGMQASFRNDSGPGTVQQKFILQTGCEAIRESPYQVDFYGVKRTCYGLMITAIHVDIFVRPPPEGMIDSLLPNVFTPNNDGVNEFFHVRATGDFCQDQFRFRIYNRWGTLMYETEDFRFEWDGKNKNGNKLPEGVYYYLMDVEFRHDSIHKRGLIHLCL